MTVRADVEALMRAALPLMARGEWAAAAESLEQAAAVHQAAGRDDEAARCLQAAATARRAGGEPAAARVLAGRAIAAAPNDLPMAVASLAQQGEAAADERRYDTAAANFGKALDAAERASLGPNTRIALLRARMAVHIALGDLAAAEADAAAGCALADPRIGAFLRTEQARLLLDRGHSAAAMRVLPPTPATDAQLLAEILVERARLARLTGVTASALDLATKARASALEAVAPVPYFTAAVEQSQALDLMNDRKGAYAALTTAWGSLADLLGRDVARSWVEPCLFALRVRWGDAVFGAIKREHDARRRASLLDLGGSKGERR